MTTATEKNILMLLQRRKLWEHSGQHLPTIAHCPIEGMLTPADHKSLPYRRHANTCRPWSHCPMGVMEAQWLTPTDYSSMSYGSHCRTVANTCRQSDNSSLPYGSYGSTVVTPADHGLIALWKQIL